jgi:hypothetical protein
LPLYNFSIDIYFRFFTPCKLEPKRFGIELLLEFIKMKKSYRNIYVCGLMFLSLLSVAGCNLANIKAEEQTVNSNTVQLEVGADHGIKKSAPNSSNAEPQIKSASVAGTYEYDTHKDGEGYDNELEIKDAGDGKLYVFLSGSYIYRVGETQSFHEAEGKGDAVLRGSQANVTLVDEEDKPCRATITFAKDRATVKISDTCRFNIALGGVYKRAAAKSADKKTNDAPRTREITFAELYEVVNDFGKYKAGERFIINDVPASKIATVSRADQFGNTNYKNLFYLEADDEEGTVANGFLTSKLLTKNLENNAEYEPATLRVTAVLVESIGKFDVSRMSFVTKIEGISGEGEVVWTAIGDEPAKIKFKH